MQSKTHSHPIGVTFGTGQGYRICHLCDPVYGNVHITLYAFNLRSTLFPKSSLHTDIHINGLDFSAIIMKCRFEEFFKKKPNLMISNINCYLFSLFKLINLLIEWRIPVSSQLKRIKRSIGQSIPEIAIIPTLLRNIEKVYSIERKSEYWTSLFLVFIYSFYL